MLAQTNQKWQKKGQKNKQIVSNLGALHHSAYYKEENPP